MTCKNLITALLLYAGLLLATAVSAQSGTPATKKANPGSQEVEYDDENYRRFMELRDQPAERNNLPTNAYQPGTQKLDKLPEASQKHLRNQLREIILQEGAWAEGDENNEYPYVPSEAAGNDAGLQQQEAEAWQELVGKYQQREARIYANSPRSKYASGAQDGTPAASQAQANAGESAGNGGADSAEAGAGEGQKQSGRQNQSASQSDTSAYAPSSSASARPDDPDVDSTAGVSQSALEYLLSKGQVSSGSQDEPAANAAAGTQAAEQSMQQLSSEPVSSPPGASTGSGQLVVIAKDTLSIKDLRNAQGISIAKDAGATQAGPADSDEDTEQSPRQNDDG